MKQTLNAICELVPAMSSDMHAWIARRRKLRRFRKMEKTAAKQAKPQTFGFKVGEVIETGNHPVVRLPAVKVGAQ